MESLSGKISSVGTVIYELPNEAIRTMRRDLTWKNYAESVVVPAGHVTGGVSKEAYDGYRQGLDSACADLVITTWLSSGQAAVVAVKRGNGKPFGGMWWSQGGAIQAYRAIPDFLIEQAEREVGIKVRRIETFMGVYRTCAEDVLCSTTNLCFVTTVDIEQVKEAQADSDHNAWRFLTPSDLEQLNQHEMHWYPMRTFRLALETMPSQSRQSGGRQYKMPTGMIDTTESPFQV